MTLRTHRVLGVLENMVDKVDLKSLAQRIAQGTPGTGQKDDVPAMINGETPASLSEGEYVIPADVVAIIGDGNNEAGAKVLDDFVAQIRKGHKGSSKHPTPFSKKP